MNQPIELVPEQDKPIDAAMIKKVMDKIKVLLIMKQLKTDSTPVEIVPYLYLGCLGAALNKKKLLEYQIKHIVSACEMPTSPYNGEFKCLIININDSITQEITSKFEESNNFIRNATLQQENAFVHCFAGKSRSTSFIIAYLIKYHQMNPNNALELIKTKRPIAQPNTGFMKQLEIYYDQLYGNKQQQQEQQQQQQSLQ